MPCLTNSTEPKSLAQDDPVCHSVKTHVLSSLTRAAEIYQGWLLGYESVSLQPRFDRDKK